jgi:rSAM/selenodomain-associated transferase 2
VTTITAIVPALNEEERIAASLASLRAAGVDELLVVDGGSRDATVAIARGAADRVLAAGGGLFAQLNAGAREARGEVLLFHYADVELPAAARCIIAEALGDPAVVGGAFRLGFDSPRFPYRLIAAAANLRNRLGLGPFGDQSIFARAAAFQRLGGFAADLPLADLDLVRRLRRVGRFVIAPDPVRASVRRWERNGVGRTALRHAWLTLRWTAGFHRRSEAEAVRELREVR